jgi:DNA-binding HxlR family transcriptional regulator
MPRQTQKILTAEFWGANDMPYDRKRPRLDPCPVEAVLSIVSGKWKARVLYLLSLDALTFGQIQKATTGIKQQVLSSLLRELEADGIVERARDGTVGPGSVYQLTAEGISLIAVLETVAAWGQRRLAGQGFVWAPPASPGRSRNAKEPRQPFGEPARLATPRGAG